jgi:hypothetical protein
MKNVRSIRNFWLDIDVDGRSSIGMGPKAKDGGFKVTVYVRDKNNISPRKLILEGYASHKGELVVTIKDDVSFEKTICSTDR